MPDLSVRIPIEKRSDEQRVVTGWASVVTTDDGSPIIDSDGHIIPVEELEKAVHNAFAENPGRGKGGDNHERAGLLDVVESFVLTKAKREALGFGDGREGWIVSFRVLDDDLWSKIKNGERPELSLRGFGEEHDA